MPLIVPTRVITQVVCALGAWHATPFLTVRRYKVSDTSLTPVNYKCHIVRRVSNFTVENFSGTPSQVNAHGDRSSW